MVMNPILWVAIFAVLIPVQLVLIQVHFHDSSPLHTHPTNMWTFILCLFIYAFAFGGYNKLQICTLQDTTYQDLCVKVALISRSLASTSLLSVLVSQSLQPVVFIICFILLIIYFARDKIMPICKNVVSCAYN